jgi:hypothetical protein
MSMLCNCCVRELLILARTCFAFGLPSKTGCDSEMKIFPYGWNIAGVVSAVMDKDHQDATRKRRAFTRVGDPSRDVKKARGIAKSAAPGSSKPSPAAKPAALAPANLHRVRRLSLPARENCLLLSPRRSEGHRLHCVLPRRQRVGPTSLWTSVWMTTAWVVSWYSMPAQGGDLLVSFFSWSLGLGQDCDEGSEARQLAVVPDPVAAAAVAGAKGASQDPWSKFCASGKITSASPLKTWRVLLLSS